MTKSTITREESVQAVFDLKVGYRLGFADIEILKRVARMALAAMDSEHKRNPVLAYADSYRDMAKQGVESVPIWSVITDLERNIAPLYRHAQPAPVVSAELLHTAASAIEGLLTTKDRTGAFVWFDLPFRLRSAANAQPVTVVPDDVRQALSKMDDEIIAELDAEESACRAAMLHAGNSPAQSDCCPAQNHASPEQNGDTPAQSQGWIPVSERMPEMGEHQCYVLAADFKNHYWPNIPNTQVGVYGDWFADGNPTWDDGDGEDLHLKEVTHWMPLPQPPTEVNRE